MVNICIKQHPFGAAYNVIEKTTLVLKICILQTWKHLWWGLGRNQQMIIIYR